jgi:hypothetical protein
MDLCSRVKNNISLVRDIVFPLEHKIDISSQPSKGPVINFMGGGGLVEMKN